MDTISMIIGVSLLAISISPFLFLNIKNKKTQKLTITKFISFTKEHFGNISKQEYWQNRVIGIDYYSDKVFFVLNKSDGESRQIIDLSKVIDCELVKEYGSENYSETSKAINKVLLNFKTRNQDLISIDFFNSEIGDKNLNGEVQLAEKWAKLINEDLKTNA